jgi:hypothetical protein
MMQYRRARITFPLAIHLGWTRISRTEAGGVELNNLLCDVDLLVRAPIDIYLSRQILSVLLS